SGASVALDHNSLVGSKRKPGWLGTPVDLLKSLVSADVDPFTLIVEVGALARPLQILEGKSRLAVHRPFRGGPGEVARWDDVENVAISNTWLWPCCSGIGNKVTYFLEGRAIFLVIGQQHFLDCWIVCSLPSLPPNQALNARGVRVTPLMPKEPPDLLQSVR